ncbi:MAG: hypothetical protein IPG43_15505 [Proteobacteria bacterium]|nr:hypothetical protein [Pseudomonadota bacterium]
MAAVLRQRPDLALVKVADGAKDNWRYLSEVLPAGTEVVDFYHAVEHLKDAFDAAYGENSPRARERFETYRHVLLEDPVGVKKVIRTLVYLRDRHPKRNALRLGVAYFRRHRGRMRYAITGHRPAHRLWRRGGRLQDLGNATAQTLWYALA